MTLSWSELEWEVPQLGISLVSSAMKAWGYKDRQSFLDLSPEIRNIIYEWLDVRRKLKAKKNGYETLPLGLSLFVTNTQIYKEAHLMIYAKLPFLVDHIPLINKIEVADGNSSRANLEYQEGLLKRLTEGQQGLALQKLHLIHRLEFKAATDFFNFLGLEAGLDTLRGTAGQGKHNILGKIFKGVKIIIIYSPHSRVGLPLKFGVRKSLWDANPPQRVRHTFPLLERMVITGPHWQEEHVVTAET